MRQWLNSKRAVGLLAAALIAIHFFLGFSAAWTASPTPDEYSYIPTAYLYAQSWDFRLDRTHPPLLRLWMGLPLQFINIQLPDDLHREMWDTPQSNVIGYQIGWDLLLSGRNPMRVILLAARIPILLLSCLLAFLLYVWAKDLYGAKGGVTTLFLYCFCPNMTAHASLATMDAGLCLFWMATLYGIYRFLKTERRTWLMGSGILLGGALAAKVTALLLVPVVLAALLFKIRNDTSSVIVPWPDALKRCAVLFVGAAATLLLLYGFPFKPFYYPDTLANVFTKSLQSGAGENMPGMPHIHYAFYLLGNYSTQGWAYYFLVCILVKTPLAIFAALLVWLALGRPKWRGWIDALLLGAIALLLMASAFNRVNIGLRHILPFYPMLYLYMGRISEFYSKRGAAAGFALLGAWLLAANSSVYPHYLTYFNEAAGGPGNGHNILDDSNIDWGQDLGRLMEIQRQFPNESFYVATNWMFQPQAFGLNAEWIHTTEQANEIIPNPPQGIVAVGKHWAIRQRMNPRSPGYFNWLEKYEPIADAGNSIWIFRFVGERKQGPDAAPSAPE